MISGGRHSFKACASGVSAAALAACSCRLHEDLMRICYRAAVPHIPCNYRQRYGAVASETRDLAPVLNLPVEASHRLMLQTAYQAYEDVHAWPCSLVLMKTC